MRPTEVRAPPTATLEILWTRFLPILELFVAVGDDLPRHSHQPSVLGKTQRLSHGVDHLGALEDGESHGQRAECIGDLQGRRRGSNQPPRRRQTAGQTDQTELPPVEDLFPDDDGS